MEVGGGATSAVGRGPGEARTATSQRHVDGLMDFVRIFSDFSGFSLFVTKSGKPEKRSPPKYWACLSTDLPNGERKATHV